MFIGHTFESSPSDLGIPFVLCSFVACVKTKTLWDCPFSLAVTPSIGSYRTCCTCFVVLVNLGWWDYAMLGDWRAFRSKEANKKQLLSQTSPIFAVPSFWSVPAREWTWAQSGQILEWPWQSMAKKPTFLDLQPRWLTSPCLLVVSPLVGGLEHFFIYWE